MSISFRLLSQHSSATRSSTLRDRHRDLDNPRFFRQSQQHAPKSHRRIHVSTKLSDRRQAMPRSQVQLMPHARLQCLQHFADLHASMNAREVIHIAGATGICKAIPTAVVCIDAEQVRTPPDLNCRHHLHQLLWPQTHTCRLQCLIGHSCAEQLLQRHALDATVHCLAAPYTTICVRLRKTALARQIASIATGRQMLLLPSTVRSSGSPPCMSDFGNLPS